MWVMGCRFDPSLVNITYTHTNQVFYLFSELNSVNVIRENKLVKLFGIRQ